MWFEHGIRIVCTSYWWPNSNKSATEVKNNCTILAGWMWPMRFAVVKACACYQSQVIDFYRFFVFFLPTEWAQVHLCFIHIGWSTFFFLSPPRIHFGLKSDDVLVPQWAAASFNCLIFFLLTPSSDSIAMVAVVKRDGILMQPHDFQIQTISHDLWFDLHFYFYSHIYIYKNLFSLPVKRIGSIVFAVHVWLSVVRRPVERGNWT